MASRKFELETTALRQSFVIITSDFIECIRYQSTREAGTIYKWGEISQSTYSEITEQMFQIARVWNHSQYLRN